MPTSILVIVSSVCNTSYQRKKKEEEEGKQMTNSEKLARWQGWKLDYKGNLCLLVPNCGVIYNIPDYLNDDSAAMSLLDTLVEKGYMVLIVGLSDDWTCQINIGAKYTRAEEASTRREAVVAAVLELIGKEGKDDV